LFSVAITEYHRLDNYKEKIYMSQIHVPKNINFTRPLPQFKLSVASIYITVFVFPKLAMQIPDEESAMCEETESQGKWPSEIDVFRNMYMRYTNIIVSTVIFALTHMYVWNYHNEIPS
jgi:hypothetical protein